MAPRAPSATKSVNSNIDRTTMKPPTIDMQRNGSEIRGNGVAKASLASLQAGRCDIMMNKIETTILTPGGDVLVCRGRDSNFMERLIPSIAVGKGAAAIQIGQPDPLCGVLASQVSDACGKTPFRDDAPEEVHLSAGVLAMPTPDSVDASSPSKENETGDSLVSPPSFDYSQYDAPSAEKVERTPLAEVPENNTDSLSKLFGSLLSQNFTEDPNKGGAVGKNDPELSAAEALATPLVMHGVPTCLPGLPEIRISSISANPLGSHVLLISSECMLFSYGLNNRGQLGLGTPETFVKSPTLVTAVLEAGGKTICCSAGVDHSIIVVKTDDQRVGRLRNAKSETVSFQRVTSSPSRISNARSNDEPDEESPDDLVMFHHQVYAFGANDNKKLGLMNQTSGSNVSLPHRVALHAKVWPDGEEAPGSLPSAGIFQVAASSNHSAALVRRATGTIELYTWGQSTALGFSTEDDCVGIPTKVDSISQEWNDSTLLKKAEYPKRIAVGPSSTFVTTSEGRCFAFGSSQYGLLGIASVAAPTPTCLRFSKNDDCIVSSISVGAKHAIAATTTGKVYAWGQDPATMETATKPQVLGSVGPAVKTCAGYDSSAFISKVGLVQTYGQKSGRLGQGEVPPNPKLPGPLFGGLRLWRDVSD